MHRIFSTKTCRENFSQARFCNKNLMAEPIAGKEDEEEEREMMEEVEEESVPKETEGMAERMRRKEKRKAKKKMKRKQMRKEMAEKEREDEEARLNDPEEQRKLRMMEEEEKERMARDRKEFEEREKAWIAAMERKKKEEEEEEEEEERRKKALEEDSRRQQQVRFVFLFDHRFSLDAEKVWEKKIKMRLFLLYYSVFLSLRFCLNDEKACRIYVEYVCGFVWLLRKCGKKKENRFMKIWLFFFVVLFYFQVCDSV